MMTGVSYSQPHGVTVTGGCATAFASPAGFVMPVPESGRVRNSSGGIVATITDPPASRLPRRTPTAS